MTKKRKLGSANPKYHRVEVVDESTLVIKKHACDAAIRDSSGNVVPGIKAPVYSVWSKKREKKNG